MRHVQLASALLGLVVLAGCGDEPAKPTTANPPPKPQTEQERQINNLGAASAVGYDGDALKRSVQKTVNIHDQQNAKLQEAAQAAGFADPADPAPAPAK